MPHHLFACSGCWYRLPVDLRRRVVAAYRQSASAHIQAMAEAVSFYEGEEAESSDG